MGRCWKRARSASQMFGFDIPGDVAFAAGAKDAGQVADAGAGLEHALADVKAQWWRPSSD